MHLAIEATKLLGERRGIGRYVRNLLRQFVQQQPSMRFTMYMARPDDAASLTALLASWHEQLAARTTVAPIDALPDSDADLVWYPWNLITTAARRPMVVSTLDLAPMLQLDDQWWRVLKRLKYRRRYERTMSKASAILTISEFSKREIVERLQVDPLRITVTLLAADDLPLDESQAPLPEPAAAVTGPFFLTVGGQEGRKNLLTLYEAMTLLHAHGMTVPLVQCGPGMSPATRALYGAAPWLTHVGYVTDERLVALYRRASALVFPSRYEGFGLPVLEAMRAGGAVICADASSLPEVVGNAALRFAWNDAAALAAQMMRLLQEPGLRDALIAAGHAQAARFSWAKTAAETLSCFDRAAAEGVSRPV
ncbi:glycosyltransferase family 4 protein [Gemmatimonas groenlandica]|nr:glycosyltransferase family 1 protein [Gemmatimonas groenlandica]